MRAKIQKVALAGEVSAGLLLIVAGGLKLFWPSAVESQTIWAQFSLNHPLVALFVVAAELLIGTALVSRRRLRSARPIAISLFAAFSAVLLRELTLPVPRLCGCLGNAGVISLSVDWQLKAGLAMNVVLLLFITFMTVIDAPSSIIQSARE